MKHVFPKNKMKALIIKGKYKNVFEEVNQWCNDWFMLNTIHKPLSPTALLFTLQGMSEILDHKNNGLLLSWFEPVEKEEYEEIGNEIYRYTFRKRK